MAIAKKPQRRTTDIPPTLDDPAAAFIAGADKQADVAPTPKPARQRMEPVLMRFDPDLTRRIDEAAHRRGLSRSAWVRMIVIDALDREPGAGA
jgi:molybdopterin-guanine dinucleotide biosynthesis protein A